jgi:hypothetical protein
LEASASAGVLYSLAEKVEPMALWTISLLMTLAVATPAAAPAGADRRACVDSRVVGSTISLTFFEQARLAPEARKEMMKEAVRLWRPAGVNLVWSDAEHGETGHLRVVTSVNGLQMPAGEWRVPIASTLFVAGMPTTLVTVYPLEAERLLSQVRMDERVLAERPPVLRERLLGRVLGRAVAHEVGHYVFRTGAHAQVGLMRANHNINALVSAHADLRIVAPYPAVCAMIENYRAAR